MDRYDFMKKALGCAKEASEHKEIPVGCVIVKNNEIIATGRNFTEEEGLATRHAEIVAIEEASKNLRTSNLTGCELYVTLEPCPMCAGAIINAKIDKVVFGAFDLNYGACGSAIQLFSMPNIHSPECFGGIMEDECSQILSDFFKNLREKNKLRAK